MIKTEITEILHRNGWRKLPFTLDINHLIKLEPMSVLEELGNTLAVVSKQMKDTPFGIFSTESREATDKFTQLLSPSPRKKLEKIEWPYISCASPHDPYDDVSDRLADILNCEMINRIRRNLGTPDKMYQVTKTDVYEQKDLSLHDNIENVCLVGDIYVVWEKKETVLKIHNDRSYSRGDVVYYRLLSNQLNSLLKQNVYNLGVHILGQKVIVGALEPEYTLSSFPPYIQQFEEQLKQQMFEDGDPSVFNLLLTSPPGHGKTRWCQSFSTEVLNKKGYLVLNLDYGVLEDLMLPKHYNRVCVIINDADNLCLNREDRVDGKTEKIMAWLDDTRSNFIKVNDNDNSRITLITANTVDRWDPAALRKGRVHEHFVFTQKLV